MSKEFEKQKLLHDLRGLLSPFVNLVPLVGALMECKKEDEEDFRAIVRENCKQIDDSGGKVREVIKKLENLHDEL